MKTFVVTLVKDPGPDVTFERECYQDEDRANERAEEVNEMWGRKVVEVKETV